MIFNNDRGFFEVEGQGEADTDNKYSSYMNKLRDKIKDLQARQKSLQTLGKAVRGSKMLKVTPKLYMTEEEQQSNLIRNGEGRRAE